MPIGATGQALRGRQSSPQITVVDNLEDGDIAEYVGNTADFTVDTTAPVFNGSHSAKCSTADSEIISTSGLPYYPQQGDTFAGQVQMNNGCAAQLAYFVQDINNYYLFEAYATGDIIRLYVKSGGSFSEISRAAVTVNNGTEYQLRATPKSNGDHVIALYNADASSLLKSFTAVDSTYSSGGVGMRQGNVGSATFDYLRVI